MVSVRKDLIWLSDVGFKLRELRDLGFTEFRFSIQSIDRRRVMLKSWRHKPRPVGRPKKEPISVCSNFEH